jgi:hypothetical protein
MTTPNQLSLRRKEKNFRLRVPKEKIQGGSNLSTRCLPWDPDTQPENRKNKGLSRQMPPERSKYTVQSSKIIPTPQGTIIL